MHANTICAKANQKLGFIKRNLKGTPEELKRLAYITLVRSSMEYACTVWDPISLSKDSESLERIQRRAARWIMRKFDHTASVSSALLHQVYLEPLEERRRISRLTFLYKVLHEHVAVSPAHLDLILADIPVRGTVTKQRLKILRCWSSTTQFQKSFVPRTITKCNTLPDSITSAASVSSFRTKASWALPHARRRAHLTVISLWSLATTFQIQIRSRISR